MSEAEPDGPEQASMAPWALQLAVRVERADRPSMLEVCTAAASAVVALLDDERSRHGGAWHEAVEAWRGRRIRKLVRRARGAPWLRVQDIAGVTVSFGAAEVRAFVPTPLDTIDHAVAKLQIDSSAVVLGEPEHGPDVDPAPGALVVAVSPLVQMSWAKQAAQVAHGAQLAWERAVPTTLAAWDERGRPVEVVYPDRGAWPAVEAASSVQVRDAGFTEVPAGTLTTVAWFEPR